MRLDRDFFTRDVLEVAPDLIGKILVHRLPDGKEIRLRITETEAYRGAEDTACHAKAGRTNRTAVLYEQGGTVYVYLCYGIHSLLNIVTAERDVPQAVLIRCLAGFNGPGKLTKAMQINLSHNHMDITQSQELWVEDDGVEASYTCAPRVGIDYASPEDRDRPWRFILKQ